LARGCGGGARTANAWAASGMNEPDYMLGAKFKVVPSEEVARILQS
jgi:hypothetical protein